MFPRLKPPAPFNQDLVPGTRIFAPTQIQIVHYCQEEYQVDLKQFKLLKHLLVLHTHKNHQKSSKFFQGWICVGDLWIFYQRIKQLWNKHTSSANPILCDENRRWIDVNITLTRWPDLGDLGLHLSKATGPVDTFVDQPKKKTLHVKPGSKSGSPKKHTWLSTGGTRFSSVGSVGGSYNGSTPQAPRHDR